MSKDWYTRWFNELYLELYSHRDTQEARRQVSFVVSECKPTLVLDIACGSGRHLQAFSEHGVSAIGIDRSEPLLNAAAKDLSLVRADMRVLPFADATFDLVTNFFTSFGYFDSDAQHLAVLKEWRRVLHAKGTLFIDYLNKEHVIASLEAETERSVGGYRVQERRSISSDGQRVEKQIRIHTPDGEQEIFSESVRMYSYSEMAKMLTEAGFSGVSVYGDHTHSSYSLTSPRMVLFARVTA